MKKIIFLSLMLFSLLLLMYKNVNQVWTISLLYWIIIFGIVITILYSLISKRWKQSIILMSIVAFLSIFFYLLGVQTPPLFREILDCHSDCISDSKKSNAFICEYSLIYNSKFNIIIEEAFMEYRHEYKNYYSRDYYIDRNSFWFNAIIDDILVLEHKGYGEKWEIEKMNCSRIVLPINIKDTIILHLNDKTTNKCIDSLVFKRAAGKDYG